MPSLAQSRRIPENPGKCPNLGDWEADLIAGCRGGGHLLSLYERKSRTGKLFKLESKDAGSTAHAIIETLQGMRVNTITYDNGLEFAGHGLVSDSLGACGYFCQPYHSKEKGGVENFNGLIRQYFPKGTNAHPRAWASNHQTT